MRAKPHLCNGASIHNIFASIQLYFSSLLLCAMLYAPPSLAQSAEPLAGIDANAALLFEYRPITLTDQQAKWVKQNRKVKVAVDRVGWPPFDVLTTNGLYRGYSGDLLLVVCRRLAIECEPVIFDTFEQALQAVESKQADILPSAEYSKERAKKYLFTTPYFYAPIWVATPTGNVFDTSRASTATWVMEKGYASTEKVKKLYPNIKLIEVANTKEAVLAIAEKKADFYAGQLLTTNYWIDHFNLTNVSLHSSKLFPPMELSIAVRDDKPQLRELLELGLRSLSPADHQVVTRRWVTRSTEERLHTSQLVVTDREQSWLDNAKTIRVAYDPGFAPFSAITKAGTPIGLSSDYLDRLATQLGFKFEYVPSADFGEALKAVVEKRADLLLAAAPTPARLRVMRFAGPYNSQPTALAVPTESPFIDDLSSLNKKRIAIAKGHFLREVLPQEAPYAQIVDCAVTLDCLKAVNEGRADAAVGNLAVLANEIQSNFVGALKIGTTLANYPSELHFGVREDWPEFVALLDRAIESTPIDEAANIRNRWLAIEVKPGLSLKQITWYVAPFLVALLSIITAIAIWNRKLSREVYLRRIAEHEAIEANNAKARFLATVTHEIRTPMNGVIGVLDLLAHSQLQHEQRGLVKVAQSSAHSLLGLLNEVLDLSKIEAGKLIVQPEPTNVLSVIENVAALFGPIAIEKRLLFTLESDPRLAQRHSIDGSRLKQILSNLISNALKFTSTGSVKIAIRCEPMSAGVQKIDVVVSDTGVGMDAEIISRLFIPFDQGSSEITKKYGGTGLGLSITQRLVSALKGTIKVQSQPNEGSSFTVSFTLPVLVEALSTHIPKRIGVCASEQLHQLISSQLMPIGSVTELIQPVQLSALGKSNYYNSFDIILIESSHVPHALLPQSQVTASDGYPPVIWVETGGDLQWMNHGDDSITISKTPWLPSALINAIETLLQSDNEKTQTAEEMARVAKINGNTQTLRTIAIMTRDQALINGALILIVDDHPTNRLLLSRQLAELGFVTDFAKDGVEALGLALNTKYAAILTDLRMPNMDGAALAEQLRQSPEPHVRDVFLALLSAEPKSHIPASTMRWFSAFLEKPIELNCLRELLNGVLERASANIHSQDEHSKAPNEKKSAVTSHPLIAMHKDAIAAADNAARLPILDWKWLITNYGNSEICKELLVEYSAIFEQDVERLHVAIKTAQLPSIITSSHTIKGALRSVGAIEAASAAYAIETCARHGELPITALLAFDNAATALRAEFAALHKP